MAIQPLGVPLPVAPTVSLQAPPVQASTAEAAGQPSFGDMLKTALEGVSSKQAASDELTNRLVRGENVEMHDVMIASQVASVAFTLTSEIRNKALEAYQEMMRMPV